METRIKRIEIGIIILIFIQLIILSLIIFNKQKPENQQDTVVEKDLPIEYNKSVQDSLLSNIAKNFNDRNFVGIHEQFSDFAKIQVSQESIKKDFDKLLKVTGKIIGTTYSNFEYDGNGEGADWFSVFYKAKFENGIGTIKIKLRVIGANWEFVGLNISLDEI